MKSSQQSMRDRVRQRAEAHRNQQGLSSLNLPEGVELYNRKKETVEFNVIPYRITVDNHPDVKKGETWYRRIYMAHRDVGPEGKFLVCPRTIGKRCPICEEYQKLNKDPDADEDVVKGLRPKERELFNIVLNGGDGAIMVLDISIHNFGLLLEQEILEGADSNATFQDLKGGKTLRVRWENKTMGKGKPFLVAGRIDFLDRDDIAEEAVDLAVDLDKALKILSYEEIEKIFQAGGDEEVKTPAEGEEPLPMDEKPARRVIGSNRKPQGPPADDEADEDQIPGLEIPSSGKAKPKEDDSDNECIACDGSGKNSKGATCKICDGTGKIDAEKGDGKEDDDDAGKDNEEEEVKKPVRRVVRR